MTIPWFGFIESNTSGTGQLFARTAQALGYRPIILTSDPARYPYITADDLAVRRVDTLDLAALEQSCRALAEEAGLVGVSSSSEYFIAAAATLAQRLGLAGPAPAAIERCRDKDQQRWALQRAGVAVPAFRGVSSVDEALQTAAQIGYPVVVKPVSGSGSSGVRLCANEQDVRVHAGTLLAQRYNERGMPLPERILVEECVVGAEYSVEIFNAAIVAITRKHLGPLPHFVEIGHDLPADLPAATAALIGSAARQAIDAVGLGWGPAHLELRVAGSGPAIIEINPRLAGGFIPELVRLATGIDLIAATIRQASGQRPMLDAQRADYAAIRFLLSPRAGLLQAVAGVERARRLPEVVAVELYQRGGQPVGRVGDFRDRIGHVLVCATTRAAALAAVEQAHGMLEVIVQ